MSTNFSLHIDPADVLGVSREASLQEIRDAYRAKAKRHHPDAGGDEWAFRILSQAYEVLSTARVVRATHREFNTPPGPSPNPAATPPPEPTPSGDARARARPKADPSETVRPGVQEPAVDPAQVVDVEKLSIRYEADHLWLITDRSAEDRFLSCCLNVAWPDPDLAVPPSTIENAESILRSLGEVFDALCVQSGAGSARYGVVEGRFSGWLNYPSGDRASAAFGQLREMLHLAGLVVKQWSRDLIIPRQWR